MQCSGFSVNLNFNFSRIFAWLTWSCRAGLTECLLQMQCPICNPMSQLCNLLFAGSHYVMAIMLSFAFSPSNPQILGIISEWNYFFQVHLTLSSGIVIKKLKSSTYQVRHCINSPELRSSSSEKNDNVSGHPNCFHTLYLNTREHCVSL